MNKCPICRGRIDDDDQCTRCGAELSRLCQLTRYARQLCIQAVGALAKGELQEAEKRINQARQIDANAITRSIQAFVRRCGAL